MNSSPQKIRIKKMEPAGSSSRTKIPKIEIKLPPRPNTTAELMKDFADWYAKRTTDPGLLPVESDLLIPAIFGLPESIDKLIPHNLADVPDWTPGLPENESQQPQVDAMQPAVPGQEQPQVDLDEWYDKVQAGEWEPAPPGSYNLPDDNIPDWIAEFPMDATYQPQVDVPGQEAWRGLVEQLAFVNARRLMSPTNLGIAFQAMPAGPDMDTAWRTVTDLSVNYKGRRKMSSMFNYRDTGELSPPGLNIWGPGTTFKGDPQQRKYFRYHPLILEVKEKTWFLVGFNDQHGTNNPDRDWVSLPTIDYLPTYRSLDNCKIIGGAAGLLVVAAGKQGKGEAINLWGRMQIPNEPFWLQDDYLAAAGQDMVFVTNPLTQHYRLLPPFPCHLMRDKVVKFIMPPQRDTYLLVIVGWDRLIEKVTLPLQHTDKKIRARDVKDPVVRIALVVYESKRGMYIYSDYVENSLPIPHTTVGKTSLAVISSGIYFGGLKIVQNTKTLNEIKAPALFYFNVGRNYRNKWFAFSVHGHKALQAPKVVQGGAGRVMAMTRSASTRPTTLLIVEVLLHSESGEPTGEFRAVDTMPKEIFQALFADAPEKAYEVTSDDGMVAFRTHSEGEARSYVAFYSVPTRRWSQSHFPMQESTQRENFLMCDAVYEPNFLTHP